MISIEEHGGVFGGSGFPFKGEYREVTLKDDVKYGDLVRVGTEFRDLPLFEDIDSPIRSVHFSPKGKYVFVIHGTGRRPALYERQYVGDNVEYRKLPNPVGFPTQVYTANAVVWSNNERLFFILNDDREYGTFQLINSVWTKIAMTFSGKNRIVDGVFSPDDEYLVLKTSSTTSGSVGDTTILKVSGINTRASFALHFTTTNAIWKFDSDYRPYFLTNRIFTTINVRTQYIVTITASTASVATGVSLLENVSHHAFLGDGRFLITSGNNSANYLVYRRNTTNVYTQIANSYDSIPASDVYTGGRPSSMFPSGDEDDCVFYSGSYGAKYRMDNKREKLVRVTGFNPMRRDGIRFPNNTQTSPPNTVDRIFTLRNSDNNGKMAREIVVGYKFSQDDEFNQEYVGIAKKGGKAGDKIVVVKITG